MAISIAGCSKEETTTPDKTTSTETAESSETTEEATEEAAESTEEEPLEEVTLTLYMGESALMTGGIQTDPIAQLIKEKTGVTLDVTIADNDKTQAMVASGDLYDINVLGKVEYIELLLKVVQFNRWIIIYNTYQK
jgi:putative aldouronate transport system substrate-binding protein